MMKYKEPTEIDDIRWLEPIVNPKPLVFGPDDKPIPIPFRWEPIEIAVWGPIKPIPFKEPGDGPEVILKEPTDDPLFMEPTDDFEDPILDGSKGSNFRWL